MKYSERIREQLRSLLLKSSILASLASSYSVIYKMTHGAELVHEILKKQTMVNVALLLPLFLFWRCSPGGGGPSSAAVLGISWAAFRLGWVSFRGRVRVVADKYDVHYPYDDLTSEQKSQVNLTTDFVDVAFGFVLATSGGLIQSVNALF